MARLRALRPSDLDRVIALEAEMFAPDDWSRDAYLDEISRDDRQYLVLEEDGTLIAWGGVLLRDQAEILTIGVDAAYRRRGHARFLLGQLLKAAQDLDISEVFLEVRADDAGAQALYLTSGFEPVGMRKRYYPFSGKDAVVMRKSLT